MPRRYFLILFFISGFCNAGFLPDAQREELSKLVLKNFWGKAKLANGDFVRPSSEAERNILPISDFVADRVIDAGEISGLGDWCKLDWESHYLSMTKAARSNGMTGKQVALFLSCTALLKSAFSRSCLKNLHVTNNIEGKYKRC